MKPKKVAPYATEAELCAAFIREVERDGNWIIYPESAGFDILLSRKSDGCQIGVEAKLKFNLHVMAQALEQYTYVDEVGPDYRAILVPDDNGIGIVAAYVGLSVIRLSATYRVDGRPTILPSLPRPGSYGDHGWHGWCPMRRHKLPEYIPDVACGVPSPLRLTDWKIGAIKIAIILETRPITRADFKALSIDHRRWTAKETQWLMPTPHGWVWGARRLNLEKEHPVNYAQIKADAPKWMPKGVAPLLDLAVA